MLGLGFGRLQPVLRVGFGEVTWNKQALARFSTRSSRESLVPPVTGPFEAFRSSPSGLDKKKHAQIVERLLPSNNDKGLLDHAWTAVSVWISPTAPVRYLFGMAVPLSPTQFLLSSQMLQPPRSGRFFWHDQFFFHPKHGLRSTKKIFYQTLQPQKISKKFPPWYGFQLVSVEQPLDSFLLPHRSKSSDTVVIPSYSPVALYPELDPHPSSAPNPSPAKTFRTSELEDENAPFTEEFSAMLKDSPLYVSLGNLFHADTPTGAPPSTPSLTPTPPLLRGDFPLVHVFSGAPGHSLSSSVPNSFSFMVALDGGRPDFYLRPEETSSESAFNSASSTPLALMSVSHPSFVSAYRQHVLPNVEGHYPEFAKHVTSQNDFPTSSPSLSSMNNYL